MPKAKPDVNPTPHKPVQVGGPQPKRGLKMSTIMMATMRGFPVRYDNVKIYGVKVVKVRADKDDANKWKFVTTEGVKGHTEAKFHHQQVLKLEPAKPFTDGRLACRCDCSDFTYTFEYALYLKGAALEPHSSNLMPAAVRNPRHLPGCCKHILSLFGYLKRRGL